MNILITGSDGFIAKNLIIHLSHNPNYNILTVNKKSSEQDLYNKLIIADIIFHLAGVNKEIYPKYTYENNYIFTKKICSFLENNYKKTKIIYASSIQVKLNNPYGKSKLKAEKILLIIKKILELKYLYIGFQIFLENGQTLIIILQLQHFVIKFTKKKITISDPNKKISLLYIDDLIFNFLKAIKFRRNKNSLVKIKRVFQITLKI
jgi:UDP-2-acetamido-2,6-beta-L-arabino-hexul-4-ose reductase